jgi:hypothetical protein
MRILVLLVLIMIPAMGMCAPHGTDKPTMKALQVRACCVAMKDFLSTENNADLNHFAVQVSEDNDSYEVIFIPDQMPNGPSVRGGRTQYGREVHYIVSRGTWQITRKTFAR